MNESRVKEYLSKQLELLAEVSKDKPTNLPELSIAMCEVTDRLTEIRDPLNRLECS